MPATTFRVPPTLLPFLMVVLLALFVVSCGDDDSTSTDDGARDASKDAASETTPDPGTPEAAAERSASGSFTLTPAIADCIGEAGFATDPKPPTGAAIAWLHPDGARLVVAASADGTFAIAGEIGTAAAPANVSETTVSTGDTKLIAAAEACLD